MFFDCSPGDSVRVMTEVLDVRARVNPQMAAIYRCIETGRRVDFSAGTAVVPSRLNAYLRQLCRSYGRST